MTASCTWQPWGPRERVGKGHHVPWGWAGHADSEVDFHPMTGRVKWSSPRGWGERNVGASGVEESRYNEDRDIKDVGE